MESLGAEISEARHGAAGDGHGLVEHRGRAHPEAALAVEGLIDDELLQCLAMAREAEHEGPGADSPERLPAGPPERLLRVRLMIDGQEVSFRRQ